VVRGGAPTVRVSLVEEDRFMAEKMMSARPGEPRAISLGLVAGFLTVALAACGQGSSPTTATGSTAQCHVACSDASSAYVAIAVSPTSLVCGAAANVGTEEEAKKQAVATCGHGDCVPVIWGRSGVAAVAVSQDAYGWGWADAASSTAEAKAVALCASRTH
jgi:hypothetical protein